MKQPLNGCSLSYYYFDDDDELVCVNHLVCTDDRLTKKIFIVLNMTQVMNMILRRTGKALQKQLLKGRR
uniref:Uncharacterized protein n=1 Tax=Octopus bimaculoides TaxID=37653 RepID=A0A0L8GE09_OCTBM